MENKLIGLVMGAVVGVILIGALLMPVLNDAAATERTFTNTGLFYADVLDENSDRTMSFDYTKPNIITVDGTDIDMSSIQTSYGSATVIFSNDWFMRFVPDTGIVLYKCGTSSSQAIKGATASSQISFTATFSSGAAVFIYSDSTEIEYDIADAGLIITPDAGAYIMKGANDTAYVNGDSIVYGVGRTDRALGTSGTSFNAMMAASVDDGVSSLYYSPQYTMNDNRSVNATADADYTDLYALSGFTFNLVSNDEAEHAITYNQIFVPTSVKSELTEHLDSGEIAVLSAIPVMMIAALVIFAVRVLYSRD